jgi:RNA polymerase sigma-70 factor (ECF subfamily)
VTPPAAPATGDRFEELFSATHERLGAAARRLVGNHHDAADVVQEVYLRAWKALPGFRGESHPFTWLYAILLNAVGTFRRRRLPEPVDTSTDDPGHHDPWADPEAWADYESLRGDAVAAMAALPEGLRLVAAHSANGCGPAEVADELGISVGAAKVRLHRARKQLRDDLVA